LDPLELVTALSDAAVAHGVQVVEGARVHSVKGRGPLRVLLADGRELATDRVVVATGMPMLDRGGFFARMTPARSYGLAFRTPGPAVDGMYLSVDPPSRSLRTAPGTDGDHLLLVGGNGHTTGRTSSELERVEELRRWTAEHFPGADETHAWSAQDYLTHHSLPYAGPVLPGSDHVLVAGGFAKWGMTNGVAAALAIAGQVLGGHQEWASAFRTWSPREVRGLARGAVANGEVGVQLTLGWLTPPRRERGSVVCTHLGGVVRWNDAEGSWDCPLHGSRFDSDGDVLEGPATCGLRTKTTKTMDEEQA
ncbi:FAD-dependent oxidoreductase, partial [Nocardioides hankookensis]